MTTWPSLELPAIAELAELPQWVCWRLEQRNGKSTKIPHTPAGSRASATDPATWSGYAECWQAAFMEGSHAGIGFVFTDRDRFCGLDLDNCRDPETGDLDPWARSMLDQLASYAEISPSGRGVKVICRANLPVLGRKRTIKANGKACGLEMYVARRYFTITGAHLESFPEAIGEASAAVAEIYGRHFGARKPNGHDPAPDLAGLDLNAPLPRAKFDELSAGSERFRKTWARQRDDLQDQSASAYDLALASQAARAGWTDNEIVALIREWRAKHGEGFKARTLRYTLARAAERRRQSTAAPDLLRRLAAAGESDTDNAERLLVRYGDRLLWTPHAGWFVWTGRQWRQDERRRVISLAQRVARLIYRECEHLADDAAKARAKWARTSKGSPRIHGLIDMASPHRAVSPDALDRDPWRFNCRNGVVDLRNGVLLPHQRRDLMTKLAPVAYDPDARCPRWRRFLLEVFKADRDLCRYVQRAVGYSLTGRTTEHCMFILWGTGRNGKTTFLEIIGELLGDYAQQAPTETFMARDRGGNIPNDLARLAGARFVSAIETEQNRRLAESLVKQATGGDRLAARFLRQEYFEFSPQFKLWLGTNHKPSIHGDDDGIWSRIRLIPFEVKFLAPEDAGPENRVKDPDLKDALRAELSGILAWAVQGGIDWQRDGLREPPKVLEATADYRSEMDALGEFIAERCDIGRAYSVKASDLYEAYAAWCGESGIEARSQTWFGRALTDRGFPREKTGMVVSPDVV